VYTGVGKVNAANALMAALTESKTNLLINFGTSGAITSSLKHIVEIGQSVWCDMDALPLGIALGMTPLKTRTEYFRLSDSPSICST